MENVTVVCFLASYSVAFVLELVRLVKRIPIRRAVMLLFGVAGLVAHTTYLIARSHQTDLPPLLSSARDWMLVLAWLGVVFYLLLSVVDSNLAVGLFLLPLVLILIGASYFVSGEPGALLTHGNEGAVVARAIRHWAMLHASLLVIGIAGVVSGFVSSMMYLVQHRRLKHRWTLVGDLKLPSLERLARLNWWAVIVSVPLLTVGMGIGIGLALYTPGHAASIALDDPVILANGGLWIAMATFFVWLLRTSRPAGRQVAWLTVWAFGFLLVTLVGLQVVAGGEYRLLPSWHASESPVRGTKDV